MPCHRLAEDDHLSYSTARPWWCGTVGARRRTARWPELVSTWPPRSAIALLCWTCGSPTRFVLRPRTRRNSSASVTGLASSRRDSVLTWWHSTERRSRFSKHGWPGRRTLGEEVFA